MAQARSNFVLDVKKFVEEADDDAMRLDLGPRAGVVSSGVLLYSCLLYTSPSPRD